MKKSWSYIIRGALIGPLIGSLLYCFVITFYYLNLSFFGFIIFVYPVFILTKFISYGVLGFIVGLLTTKYLNKMSVKNCVILATVGGLISFFFIILMVVITPYLDILFGSTYQPQLDLRIITDLFSNQAPLVASWIPSAPNLYNTLIEILSGSILSLILFYFVHKKYSDVTSNKINDGL